MTETATTTTAQSQENSAYDSPPNSANEIKQVYSGALAANPKLSYRQGAQIRFTMLISGLAACLGISSMLVIILTTGSLFVSEQAIWTLIAGHAIGGAQLGLAASLVLWHYFKNGRAMQIPLAWHNLFVLLLNIPFGFAIGACLNVIFFMDTANYIEFTSLFWIPLWAMRVFYWELYWVALLLLPLAAICWRCELFLIGRIFNAPTSPIPTTATATDKGASFNIKQRSAAVRCDTCHKDDLFVAKTGFCRRCQRYSV
ncbi:MAG: hypothetical protein AB1489_38770 [Acidobacteriota bacterium]